jgi:hypothetical protein
LHACQPGYQRIGDNCINCPYGSYRDTWHCGPCVSCPEGSTNQASVASQLTSITQCLPIRKTCPTHYYSAQLPYYECIECPAGKHSDTGTWVRELSNCITCDSVPYTNTVNGPITMALYHYDKVNQVCSCAKGYDWVSDWNINSQCTACGPNTGKSWVDIDVTRAYPDCARCVENWPGFSMGSISVSAAGNGSQSVGATTCMCMPGWTGPDLSASKYVSGHICTACAEGTYKDSIGSVSCTPCPAKSYSAIKSKSMTDCTCNSGFYKVGTNPFTCEPNACAAGSTGPAGSCTLCIAGKYKAVTGSAACDDCVVSKFSAGTGQISGTTCQNCAAGKYASLTGSSVCENCLAGKYSATTGQSSSDTCQDCPAGKFSTTSGQSSSATCQDCLAGKYSTLTGQSSSGTCQDCSAGKFSGLTGQSSLDTCQHCSAGKYSTATGQSSTGTCQNCAAGKYSALTGQSSSATCENCLEGKYSALTGQSSSATCLDCLAGKYSTATGQSTCQDCLAGKYSTLTGQSSSGTCEDCSAGKYSTTTGQSSSATCQNCLAGKYSTATGQSTSATCQNCLAGTYATFTGSTVCENCLAGKYSAATGQSSSATCQDCLPGKFNSATAQSSCQDCPALSSSSAGSSECFCNPGYWDSYASCKQCPLGKYRDHVCLATPCAENTCLACPSGTYAPTTGQSACTKCPVGKSGINT